MGTPALKGTGVQTHPASRIDELMPHNWTPPTPPKSSRRPDRLAANTNRTRRKSSPRKRGHGDDYLNTSVLGLLRFRCPSSTWWPCPIARDAVDDRGRARLPAMAGPR